MCKRIGVVGFLFLSICSMQLVGATSFYVSSSGGNTSPYDSWSNAATTIQTAVDQAQDGDTVWVTNGTYDAGATITPGYALNNRVYLNKAITLQSVNGPEATKIVGAGPVGASAMRSLYIASSAVVSGFTISGGATLNSGDPLYDCSGAGALLESGAVVTNCVLHSNSAYIDGGGAYLHNGGSLVNSTISNNESTTDDAGGVYVYYDGLIANCLLTENYAEDGGGGIVLTRGGIVNNCTLIGNTANRIGGLYLYRGGEVNNCIAWGNTGVDARNDYAKFNSVGIIRFSCGSDGVTHEIDGCITNQPLFSSAQNYQLQVGSPCVDAGDDASALGGTDILGNRRISGQHVDMGAYEQVLDSDGDGLSDDDEVSMYNTDPLKADTDDDQINDKDELENGLNPLISNVSTDSDGDYISDKAEVDNGLDPLSSNAGIDSDSDGIEDKDEIDNGLNPLVSNEGVDSDGDGTLDADEVAEGTDPLYVEVTLYVDVNRPDDSGNGLTWATAKKSIQAAVSLLHDKDAVMVGPGVYYPAAEIFITHAIQVRSSEGAATTTVDGSGAHRCFNISGDAVLDGFTIANGFAENGGGVYCNVGTVRNSIISGNKVNNHDEVLFPSSKGGGIYCVEGKIENCTFSGNANGAEDARGGGLYGGVANNCSFSENTVSGIWESSGGGMYGGTASNCIFSGNSVRSGVGGGAYGSTANGCTFFGNSADYGAGGGMGGGIANNCSFFGNSAGEGGGMSFGTANNCMFYGNTAEYIGGGMISGTANNSILYGNSANENDDVYSSTCSFSCSPGLSGNGNISADPLFVDAANEDFRLNEASPCIDAGTNAYVRGSMDQDGNFRISGSVVDMGAYEFQQVRFITAECSPFGGRISPVGAQSVPYGFGVDFFMTASNYCHIVDVETNGISVGAVSAFSWDPVRGNGTIYAKFTENLATNNTPEWWLAQYGWTNDFDAAALADSDGDGLAAWMEYEQGTLPDNADSDNDQLKDGSEVAAGSDPLRDDSAVIAQIRDQGSDFGLYASNVVLDVSVGQMLLESSGGFVALSLQLEQSEDLQSWTNAGDAVEWNLPVGDEKKYFRVRAGQ